MPATLRGRPNRASDGVTCVQKSQFRNSVFNRDNLGPKLLQKALRLQSERVRVTVSHSARWFTS